MKRKKYVTTWLNRSSDRKIKKKIYALPLGHAHNITWNVYSIYVASSMTVLEKSLIEIQFSVQKFNVNVYYDVFLT